MIDIQVTSEHRYRVVYRLEGVVCSIVECAELKTALEEVERKMKMLMGLSKGMTFLTHRGREL